MGAEQGEFRGRGRRGAGKLMGRKVKFLFALIRAIEGTAADATPFIYVETYQVSEYTARTCVTCKRNSQRDFD
jgi:hypothetical protein